MDEVVVVKAEPPCSPPTSSLGPAQFLSAASLALPEAVSNSGVTIPAVSSGNRVSGSSSVVLAPTTRPGVFQITGAHLPGLTTSSSGNQKVTYHQIEASTLHALQQSLGLTARSTSAAVAPSPTVATLGTAPLATRVIPISTVAAGSHVTDEVSRRHQSPSSTALPIHQSYMIGQRTVVPVQMQQGQTFAVRSTAPRKTLLIPKSGSPAKNSQGAPQMFVPIAVSAGVPTPSSGGTIAVRPIAPRMFVSGAPLRPTVPNLATSQPQASQPRSTRTQPQLYPKTAAAPQPQTFILPSPAQTSGGPILPRGMVAANSDFRQVYRLVTPTGQLVPINYVQPIAAKNSACILPQPFTEQVETEPENNFNGGMQVDTKVMRKPCNCTKSQCLKLYCDCFANGEFCIDCNCNNCFNNLEHEAERGKAIKQCLERNSFAFHPKIGKGKGEAERMHTKGCHCKRSGCLKNYCECYEAKILCSALCKCTGCKNFEESPERKTLMHLADAAEVRVLQQTAAQTKLESQMEHCPGKLWPAPDDSRLPFSFITTDVAEATADCLLLTAEESIARGESSVQTEHVIIEEFGRCLMQIIQTANKTKELFSQST